MKDMGHKRTITDSQQISDGPESGEARVSAGSERRQNPPSAMPKEESIEGTRESEECPDWYPVWEWIDSSCSLDATLLVALQICENLPGYAASNEQSADSAFQTLYSHHLRWRSKPWNLREMETMTEARNAVRKVLAISPPPVSVTAKSPLSATLGRVIPPRMMELEIRYRYSCRNKTCMQKNEIEKTSQDILRHPSWLSYPASYQKSTDTQTLLDRVVRTRS